MRGGEGERMKVRGEDEGVRGGGLRSDVHVVVRMWRVSAEEKRK